MEKILKILSYFIVLFFSINIFALTGFFNAKSVVTDGSAIEQFYSTVSVPSDIIGKMMSGKAQNKTSADGTQSKDSKDNFKINEYVVTATVVISMLTAGFVLCRDRDLKEYLVKVIKYPLKIPLRVEIFLLMIMKMLFNVLPRSSEDNVFVYGVRKACVL